MTQLDVRLVGTPLRAGAAPLIAVAVQSGSDGPVPGADATALAAELGVDLAAHLAGEKAKGEVGEVHVLPAYGRLGTTTHLLLVGVGAPDGPPHALRRVGAALARRATKLGTHLATSVPAGRSADHLGAFAEGLALASYTFRTTVPKGDEPSGLTTVDVHGAGKSASARAAADRARTHVEAVLLARDLANEPSLDKTPEWLAKRAVKAAKAAGVATEVLEPAELQRRGFGGIIGVGSGAGAARGPRFIRLDHIPGRRRSPHVVLVGKGITFDTGGLSLKPNEGMAAMKTDMSGGAAVIAVLQAAGRTALPVRLTGLVCAAENMPSGTAMRPGDVLRHYDGRTVEVLNTDAEGRLVLADGLAYAVAELKPDYIVDIATLTGAIGIALGKRTAGLFASDDGLASALLAAADRAGETLLADAAGRGLPRGPGLARGGPEEHRRPVQRRGDHRRAVPPGVRRRGAVGAPRRRERGPLRRRRRGARQGRHRVRGADAALLARGPGERPVTLPPSVVPAVLGKVAQTPFNGSRGVFAVILLEIALGSLAVLWVTPVWGVVKRGFFLLVASTVAVCAVLGQLAASGPLDRLTGAGRATAALWAFSALSVLFTAALVLKRLPVARVLGILGVPAGVWALVEIALLRADGDVPRAIGGVAALLTGAVFLGATWDGMVLGHWYLVDRKLSPRPMEALALAFSISVGLALVSAALGRGGEVTAAEQNLNPLLLVSSLTLYLAIGLVAVNALLAFFVHKLVNEGSIRAATGMLYLAVIMAFSAEFAAKARFFTV